ncbi:MAG: ADP-ribosyltransferase [Elusimicrobiota bacterium]|nr:ADP-ribosyltransferase [Elusimicrobiota bacterium]
MKVIKRLFTGGLAAVLAVLFVNTVKAADLSFDGAAGGISLAETLRSFESRSADQFQPPLAPAPAGARVYDFKLLYGGLGYPSPDYFGSDETEVMDLESYTSKEDSFYGEINGYLRFYPAPYEWYGTGPEDAKIIVKNIDRVFDRAPALPGDLMLFRGLDLKFRDNKAYAIGEEFIDKGYVSTSVSYKVARYFAIEIGDNETTASRKAVFALYLNRPGEKGILVDQGEDEVILRHGMKFRVMAKKDGVKKYDLYLVQACLSACADSLPGDVRGFWRNFSVQD